MPGFDGTGPQGRGPMTGGGRGFCNPYGTRAVARPYGFRRWTGYRSTFGTVPTPEQELDYLKNEAQLLRRSLEGIDARIKELSGEGK